MITYLTILQLVDISTEYFGIFQFFPTSNNKKRACLCKYVNMYLEMLRKITDQGSVEQIRLKFNNRLKFSNALLSSIVPSYKYEGAHFLTPSPTLGYHQTFSLLLFKWRRTRYLTIANIERDVLFSMTPLPAFSTIYKHFSLYGYCILSLFQLQLSSSLSLAHIPPLSCERINMSIYMCSRVPTYNRDWLEKPSQGKLVVCSAMFASATRGKHISIFQNMDTAQHSHESEELYQVKYLTSLFK